MDNGGPAFPIQGFSTRSGQGFQAVMADGMTLRDYFAAKAMQGILANPTMAASIKIAGAAYAVAERLCNARTYAITPTRAMELLFAGVLISLFSPIAMRIAASVIPTWSRASGFGSFSSKWRPRDVH